MSRLLHGDAIEQMQTLDAASIDACVTDPPYGISFMGRAWDHGVPGEPYWREVLRVLKPGAHLLAFGGTRTHHRLMCAIEDAGFEICDCLMWLYGSGFPKGKGCLKPGWEPIVKAHKKGRHWINVDGCRVEAIGGLTPGGAHTGASPNPMNRAVGFVENRPRAEQHPAGRWPANCVLSHEDGCREVGTKRVKGQSGGNGISHGAKTANIYGQPTDHPVTPYKDADGLETVTAWECVESCPVRLLDEQSGERITGAGGHQRVLTSKGYRGGGIGQRKAIDHEMTAIAKPGYADTGGASRFFYCAKASPRERNAGMPEGTTNQHPTVKPQSLMVWLTKLVTPTGGTVLDPFMGSGTTGCAAAQLGFDFIGIDNDPESVRTAEYRIAYWSSPAAYQKVPTRRDETRDRLACDTTGTRQLGLPIDLLSPDLASA